MSYEPALATPGSSSESSPACRHPWKDFACNFRSLRLRAFFWPRMSFLSTLIDDPAKFIPRIVNSRGNARETGEDRSLDHDMSVSTSNNTFYHATNSPKSSIHLICSPNDFRGFSLIVRIVHGTRANKIENAYFWLSCESDAVRSMAIASFSQDREQAGDY